MTDTEFYFNNKNVFIQNTVKTNHPSISKLSWIVVPMIKRNISYKVKTQMEK